MAIQVRRFSMKLFLSNSNNSNKSEIDLQTGCACGDDKQTF